MEWAHLGLCGTQAHIGPSQVLGWCPVSLYFYLFLFRYFFSSSNWTPFKNSGSNPMSFLFLVGVPWCTNEIGPLLEEILATTLPTVASARPVSADRPTVFSVRPLSASSTAHRRASLPLPSAPPRRTLGPRPVTQARLSSELFATGRRATPRPPRN